jgi:hypothetical protein
MIAEKESLMDQYKSIAEQKAVIDQAQEPLLKELNEVKKQIEDFDGQRQEAQVCTYLPLSRSTHNCLSACPRLELRKPLSSDWLHRMSNITGRKNSLTRKRSYGKQRSNWMLSNRSLRQVEDIPYLASSYSLGFLELDNRSRGVLRPCA